MELLQQILNINHDLKNTKEEFIDEFKLPIEYLDSNDLKELDDNLINDLELIKFKDISNNENLYYSVFLPKNDIEKEYINRWSKLYTNNKNYLNDFQSLIKNYKPSIKSFDINESFDNLKTELTTCDDLSLNFLDDFYNCSQNIFFDNGFIEKYNFIDFPYFMEYNKNETVTGLLSVYNICSPIFALLVPIISLILPFFIIKVQGYELCLENYIEHLKNVFQKHIFGEFMNNFQDSSFSSKIYIFISIGFYIFQLYMNYISCKKYFSNLDFISKTLNKFKKYLKISIDNFDNLLSYTKNLVSFNNFNIDLENRKEYLLKFLNDIININFDTLKPETYLTLGNLMKNFYKLYAEKDVVKSMFYSFGLNSFIKNIESLKNLYNNNVINTCNFTSNKSIKFKNLYFSVLIDKNKLSSKDIVKNNIELKNNIIITGPNASGKTTILKSILFNTILSQQIGFGFYDSAEIKLYDYIHCYINIPDTSNRDSLYQAEARQCKEILEKIDNNLDKNHLCVFDELYSGTNPEEAIQSARVYLEHLSNNNNVNYVLTTHYIKLCKKIKNTKTSNYFMSVQDDGNDFNFTYKIKKGINKTKGGIKVLKDLEYPEKLLKEIIKNE